MIPKELFAKVRQIEITTSRLVTDVFAGQYHSVFKGQGIEFDEVREYQPGDDVRAIDWNVTARTGKPYIKKYVEERELTVMILVDVSGSSRFGSAHAMKSRIAAEISAVLSFSAIRNKDKVGLIIFSDKIEKYIPPRKGTRHVLRVIREVLHFEPEGHGTDIQGALEYLNRVAHQKTITFLISDFLEDRPEGLSWTEAFAGLKKTLSVTNKRHDLIAITLNDPRESTLPNCGLITLQDAETGALITLDTSSRAVRDEFQKQNEARRHSRSRLFLQTGMDYVDIETDQPYTGALVKFFLKRRKRVR